MSSAKQSPRDSLPGPQHIERMLRVSPLTISAVYKKADKIGQGYVLNLSRGGVFLTTDTVFQMGEEFRLRFFLPFQLGTVDAKVVVRWRTQDVPNPPKELRSGFGVEFVQIDPEMRENISRFVEKFVELAEQLES